jgi:hypothetical protein
MEKILKSIKFPGLDDVYVIPEGGSGAVDIDLFGSAEGGVKPQSPLKHTESGDYFYPLTTMDQVITNDGGRLSGLNMLTVDNENVIEGETTPINDDTLGGFKAEEYVKKSDPLPEVNYSIVASLDEPENPTENLIWLKTDIPINKVFLGNDTPTEVLSNGDIHIYTDKHSNVSFYEFKIANVYMNMVYPLYVTQYIDDTWVVKEAVSRKGDAWVKWWDGTLYDAGNEYEYITGGWETSGNVTKNASSITVYAPSNGTSSCTTKNLINFKNAKTFEINVTSSSGSKETSDSRQGVHIINSSGTIVASKGLSSTGKKTIDVTTLNDEYRIQIQVFSAAPNYTYTTVFNQVKLYY